MYSNGDLIKVLGVTNDGTHESWYAEVVGVVSERRQLEVYYLEAGLDRVYRFSKDWYEVSYDSVEEHLTIPSKSRKAYMDGWKTFGFVCGGDGQTFCRQEDEQTVMLPLGEVDTDDESEVEEGRADLNGYISDDGFVVNDDEPFTFADATSDFVKETHQAVREYEAWAPTTPSAKKIKQFIDKMDTKATHIEADKTFVKGVSALQTNRPPL